MEFVSLDQILTNIPPRSASIVDTRRHVPASKFSGSEAHVSHGSQLACDDISASTQSTEANEDTYRSPCLETMLVRMERVVADAIQSQRAILADSIKDKVIAAMEAQHNRFVETLLERISHCQLASNRSQTTAVGDERNSPETDVECPFHQAPRNRISVAQSFSSAASSRLQERFADRNFDSPELSRSTSIVSKKSGRLDVQGVQTDVASKVLASAKLLRIFEQHQKGDNLPALPRLQEEDRKGRLKTYVGEGELEDSTDMSVPMSQFRSSRTSKTSKPPSQASGTISRQVTEQTPPFDSENTAREEEDGEDNSSAGLPSTVPLPLVAASRLTGRRNSRSMIEVREQWNAEIILPSKLSSDIDDASELDTGTAFGNSQPKALSVARLVLRIFGILPWRTAKARSPLLCFSVLYQLAVLSMALSAAVYYFDRLVFLRGSCISEIATDGNCTAALLSDVVLTCGGVLGLISFVDWFGNDADECRALLLAYGSREEFFLERWAQHTLMDFLSALVIWVLALAERARGALHMVVGSSHVKQAATTTPSYESLYFFAFAFSTGVLIGLASCLIHFCRALGAMLDTFCCKVAETDHLIGAAADWNVIQAVIRKTCNVVQNCMLIFQVLATSALFCFVIDLGRGLTGSLNSHIPLLPGILIMLYIVRVFFCAAAISDKCARVPSVVNSLGLDREHDLDARRQELVQFIIHSAAGFYVFETSINSFLVMKSIYFASAVAFGLATEFVFK